MTQPPRYRMDAGDAAKPFDHAIEHAFKSAQRMMHNYEPEDTYELEVDIASFFAKELGIRFPNDNVHNHTAITNGTTGGYAQILKLIAADFETEKERAKSYGASGDVKPVILVPVPTYGLFIPQPRELGMDIVRVPREPDGSVSPDELQRVINEVHQDGSRHVVAYFDSNPNNPTGHIREEAETRALGDVIKKHNQSSMAERDQNPSNVSLPIRIIDDMVYLGLETCDKKPASFMQDPELFNNTFLLAGGSKIGLAGLRTGLVIGNVPFIGRMMEDTFRQQCVPSTPAMYALEAAFPTAEPHIQARQEYLDECKEHYMIAGKLMKALVNGLGAVDATPEEEQRMVTVVAETLQLSEGQALTRLEEGIEGVSVVSNPEAGFFHLLDFSGLKGTHYHGGYVRNPDYYKERLTMSEAGTVKVGSDLDIGLVSVQNDVLFISGTTMGVGPQEMLMRASFGHPLETIVEAMEQTKQVVQKRFHATEQEALQDPPMRAKEPAMAR